MKEKVFNLNVLPEYNGNRIDKFLQSHLNKISRTKIQNLIREDKVFQITSIMQTAMAEGMITMDKAIENLKAMGSI